MTISLQLSWYLNGRPPPRRRSPRGEIAVVVPGAAPRRAGAHGEDAAVHGTDAAAEPSLHPSKASDRQMHSAACICDSRERPPAPDDTPSRPAPHIRAHAERDARTRAHTRTTHQFRAVAGRTERASFRCAAEPRAPALNAPGGGQHMQPRHIRLSSPSLPSAPFSLVACGVGGKRKIAQGRLPATKARGRLRSKHGYTRPVQEHATACPRYAAATESPSTACPHR